MKFNKIIVNISYTLIFLCISSCKKWVDEKGPDLGLTNKYCNIPDAVNYNWGFPGIADSLVCYYPADVFKGDFILHDSIFGTNDSFISAHSKQLHIEANGKERF